MTRTDARRSPRPSEARGAGAANRRCPSRRSSRCSGPPATRRSRGSCMRQPNLTVTDRQAAASERVLTWFAALAGEIRQTEPGTPVQSVPELVYMAGELDLGQQGKVRDRMKPAAIEELIRRSAREQGVELLEHRELADVRGVAAEATAILGNLGRIPTELTHRQRQREHHDLDRRQGHRERRRAQARGRDAAGGRGEGRREDQGQRRRGRDPRQPRGRRHLVQARQDQGRRRPRQGHQGRGQGRRPRDRQGQRHARGRRQVELVGADHDRHARRQRHRRRGHRQGHGRHAGHVRRQRRRDRSTTSASRASPSTGRCSRRPSPTSPRRRARAPRRASPAGRSARPSRATRPAATAARSRSPGSSEPRCPRRNRLEIRTSSVTFASGRLP